MSDDPVVIVAARRTPIGSFQGALASVTAPELAAAAIRAAIGDVRLEGSGIDEVLLGCVLPAGIGQAPARQALLAAGIPDKVPAVTLNKVCGSGMKTVMIARDSVLAGSNSIVVAGGMESMTNAPYLLPKARAGYRLGHQQVIDHMFFDGLENPYDGKLMGYFAEKTAEKYGFGREAQDAFATESVKRAQNAIATGAFSAEVTPVIVTTRKGESRVETDEGPGRLDVAKIPKLRPAFKPDGGTVTAASSASISDGAAALVLMRESEARQRGLDTLARIVAQAGSAQAPEWFTTAPVQALKAVLSKAGWKAGEVDLYEINEAFAVVTMAAERELALDHVRVNVNGGACALGHPIGCSGARILVTLIHAMRARGARRGVASLCIGGGEATAVAVELP